MSALAASRLPAVDHYIAEAQPFAQPILRHLRDTLHRAAPGVQEAIKWSRPFFLYHGIILGNIAAFQRHCSFGLWGEGIAGTLRAAGIQSGEAMGTFGRISTLADLPSDAALEGYIRQAAALIDTGARTRSFQRVAKADAVEPPLPAALAVALQGNQAAATRFAALSASCRREYIDWIAGAKREDTRSKRTGATLAAIAREDKPRARRQGPQFPVSSPSDHPAQPETWRTAQRKPQTAPGR